VPEEEPDDHGWLLFFVLVAFTVFVALIAIAVVLTVVSDLPTR
jgi:hypothetical protein